MFKLYAYKGYGSAAVEALLAEAGARYQVEAVARDAEGAYPAWFLKINPAAQIPALQLPDGTVMTESAAMMIHVADLYPEKRLAPAPGAPGRAAYLRWMLFLATAVYGADIRYYYPQRQSMVAEHGPAIKEKAAANMARAFALLDEGMGPGPFILGEQFSGADLYVAMLISWSPDVAGLFRQHPKLKTLAERVAARPLVAPIWAANKI